MVTMATNKVSTVADNSREAPKDICDASRMAFTYGKVPIPKQATPNAETANIVANAFEPTPYCR